MCSAVLFVSVAGAQSSADLRVLSFNVRYPNPDDGANVWPQRRDLLIETLRGLDADLIGTQELFASQGDEIVARLPQYRWFGLSRRGDRTDEHMGVFYRHQKLKLMESGNFWLSTTPDRPGSSDWEMSLPRMATWGLFEDKTGQRFYYFNTHFPHRKEDAEARVQCAKVLMSRLPKDVPVILTGDFNTGVDSDAYKEIAAQLQDAWRTAPRRSGPTGTFHGFTGKPGADRIDWILFRGPWKVRQVDTVTRNDNGRFPSDHFPVLAVLTIPPTGAEAAGRAAHAKGDYAGARKAFEQALQAIETSPPDNPRRYVLFREIFAACSAAGNYPDAENFLEQAIAWRESHDKANTAGLASDMTDLAMLVRAQADYPRGLAILNRVVSMHVRPPNSFDNFDVADDFSRMALFHLALKDYESTAGALKTALQIRENLAGPEHPALLSELDRLASVYVTARSYEQGEETYRRALLIRERALGREDPDVIQNLDGLAYALFGQKKFAEAEPVYQRLLALWELSTSKDHPMVALTLDKMTVFYRDQKKEAEAAEAAARANAIRALLLAKGLAREAGEQFARNNKKDAVVLYQRALVVLDPARPEHADLRQQVETLAKDLASAAPKPRR